MDNIVKAIIKFNEQHNARMDELIEKANQPEVVNELCSIVGLLDEKNFTKLLCAVTRENLTRIKFKPMIRMTDV